MPLIKECDNTYIVICKFQNCYLFVFSSVNSFKSSDTNEKRHVFQFFMETLQLSDDTFLIAILDSTTSNIDLFFLIIGHCKKMHDLEHDGVMDYKSVHIFLSTESQFFTSPGTKFQIKLPLKVKALATFICIWPILLEMGCPHSSDCVRIRV